MSVASIEPISDDSPFGAVYAIREAILSTPGLTLGPRVEAVMTARHVSPLDTTVNSAEALYAATLAESPGPNRDALAVACAQLTDLIVRYQFQELGSTDRGPRMNGACLRIVGLGIQDESLDPTILPYLVD